MAKKKENKKNKKVLIVTSIVIVAILVIVLGGFLGYKYYEKTNTVGTNWGDTYYQYIKESKTNKDIKIENNSTLEFIDVPDVEEPVMISNYQKDNKSYTNIYYINKDEVKNIIDLEPSEVELLYSIEEKKYNWYLHKTTEQEEKFTPLSKVIDKKSDTSKEYTIKPNEEITQDTTDGNKITLTKFDTLFIKPEIERITIDYKKDVEEKDLKETIKNTIKDYKTTKEIEKEVKEEVEKKQTEIEKTKEEMKKAEEAVKQKAEEEKKRQEEEAKRKEEEAKQGLKVGNYTLKYGTYIGEAAVEGDRFVLQPNGQCTYNGASCTYSIGNHDFAQDASTVGSYRTCLVVNAEYTMYLMPYTNTSLGDGDIGNYNYAGS